MLRLPWEVSPLFQQWLEQHLPDRAERVMARVREMRGGKDYDAKFGTRMTGTGIWAQMIRQRFDKASAKLGFNRDALRARPFAVSQAGAAARPGLALLAVPSEHGGSGSASPLVLPLVVTGGR